MAKNKNAFAFRDVAKMFPYGENFDEYTRVQLADFSGVIPVYQFCKHFNEGYIKDDDIVSQIIVQIAAKVIYRITHKDIFPPKSPNFFDLKFHIDSLQTVHGELEESRQRIDRHIARLHCYQESLLTAFSESDTENNFDVPFFQRQLKRVKRLISLYSDIESNLFEIQNFIAEIKKFEMSELIKQFSKEFGERVRTARSEKKLRQADIAAALDIPLPTYSQYERGIREPPLFVIHRLTKILDKSADYLLATDT